MTSNFESRVQELDSKITELRNEAVKVFADELCNIGKPRTENQRTSATIKDEISSLINDKKALHEHKELIESANSCRAAVCEALEKSIQYSLSAVENLAQQKNSILSPLAIQKELQKSIVTSLLMVANFEKAQTGGPLYSHIKLASSEPVLQKKRVRFAQVDNEEQKITDDMNNNATENNNDDDNDIDDKKKEDEEQPTKKPKMQVDASVVFNEMRRAVASNDCEQVTACLDKTKRCHRFMNRWFIQASVTKMNHSLHALISYCHNNCGWGKDNCCMDLHNLCTIDAGVRAALRQYIKEHNLTPQESDDEEESLNADDQELEAAIHQDSYKDTLRIAKKMYFWPHEYQEYFFVLAEILNNKEALRALHDYCKWYCKPELQQKPCSMQNALPALPKLRKILEEKNEN